MGSLMIFLTVGVLAFRAMGGIIGAVANSMQESQIIIQILYFRCCSWAAPPSRWAR
jgi:hypothetical protein